MMCHSIEIEKDWKLAYITASCTVDALELKEIFFETVSHEDWQAGFNMLCDYSRIEHFDVTYQDIDKINEWQTSIDVLIGKGRCAVVASRDFVYGMTRMWEIISSNRQQQISVFRQVKDALIWLGCPDSE